MTQAKSATVVTAPSDTEMVVTRTFNASPERVFDAWTQCEHVKRWFGRPGDEMSACDIDLRAGGTWRFAWKLREGGEMGLYGEYLDVQRPHRLVQTEAFEGEELFEEMGGGTVNTFAFEDRDGATLMTMTVAYNSREARDSAMSTDMEEGMDESFRRLDELLGAA